MALVTNSYEPQNVQRPMSNVQCPTSRLVIGHSTLDICLSYGEGGIRTPDRGISPYNGLANRRLQPLGHLSSRCGNSQFADGSATPTSRVKSATDKSSRRHDECVAVPMYVNGREVGDRSVGAREVPCREHRRERDHRGARASGRGNTCRRIFEHDTCCGVESEAFRCEAITIGRRLSL